MTAQHFLQIAVACVAAGTPWMVVGVALRIASAHASTVGAPMAAPPAVRSLTRATLFVLPLVAAAAWLLTPSSLLMGALDVAAFVLLSIIGFPALQGIETASRPARSLKSAERLASLRPRRLGQYLPFPVRALPVIVTGLGVILLGWRLTSLTIDRPLVPLGFILSAPVFVWLYEVWLRAEVSGGEVIGLDESVADRARRRRVQRIFAVELTLAVGLMAAGHALLGSDWTRDGAWVAFASLAGAVLGVLGCALALSSELSRRRYLKHEALQ